jgi:sec-independent protein translocase protein TatB
MPSFPDSAVLILLVLLLFGPKKLPELARQFGKLMADFRRASNEFRSQMEDELRISEQADRQKQIAAAEAAAPATPALEAAPDATQSLDAESVYANQGQPSLDSALQSTSHDPLDSMEHFTRESAYDSLPEPVHEPSPDSAPAPEPAAAPLPIATSGELSLLPPPTGLPIANSSLLPFPEDPPTESAAQPSVTPHAPEAHQTEEMHG